MIVTVTLNPAVDYTILLSQPLSDSTIVRTNDYLFTAGGKGINVSHYLDQLDVATMTTGLLGGLTGEFIRTELSRQQFECNFDDIDGTTRLNTTILTGDTEYKINQSGPTVSEENVDSIIKTVDAYDPETVVVAGSLPVGLGADSIDRIATAGDWQTAVDVGGELLASLTSKYYLCTPNRTELARATGMDTDTVDQCRRACRSLLDEGFKYVLTTLGDDGAILITDEIELYAPPLDVPVVDTVGAGDGLLSGVLAAFAEGKSPEEALCWGIAIASRVVSTTGTRVDRLEDITELSGEVTIHSLAD